MINYIKSALVSKEQQTPSYSLIEALVRNLGRKYPERSHKTVHASGVTKDDFCPRQYLLMDAHNVSAPDKFINAGLKATFDVGEATAALVVKWMGQRAWGKWVSADGTNTIPFGTMPEGVYGKDWHYHEVKFMGSCAVSGSIDLIADLGHPKKRIVELKIMKVDDFDKLAAPLAEHRLRTQLYLHLIATSENPVRFLLDTDEAHILYVSRGFGKKNEDVGQIVPFKEFTVKRDDQAVAEYIERGNMVKTCREQKTIPVIKVCDNIMCPTAKKCPVRQQCWSS